MVERRHMAADEDLDEVQRDPDGLKVMPPPLDLATSPYSNMSEEVMKGMNHCIKDWAAPSMLHQSSAVMMSFD